MKYALARAAANLATRLWWATGAVCAAPEPGEPLACGAMTAVSLINTGAFAYLDYLYAQNVVSYWKEFAAAGKPWPGGACGY